MTGDFVSVLNDPDQSMIRLMTELKCRQGAGLDRGRFVLAIGGTETSDLVGISAAGISPELRRLTPKIDAEALVSSDAGPEAELPVSPAGIVSPVVLTRAGLKLAELPASVVDCGTFISPACKFLSVADQPARCLSTGHALELSGVKKLFEAGLEFGNECGRYASYLVLGECVPGGTTTGLAILNALGWQADSLVSSSLIKADHGFRSRLVQAGLQRARTSGLLDEREPLTAVAAVGDPMQPFAAGAAISAAREIPVVLAGGSQMLAVWALIGALVDVQPSLCPVQPVGVITTKWVALDASAGSVALARKLGAPFAAVYPDLSKSRHSGLQAYEDGHVKEGVGAGGAIAAAYLCGGANHEAILREIDDTYQKMVPTRMHQASNRR